MIFAKKLVILLISVILSCILSGQLFAADYRAILISFCLATVGLYKILSFLTIELMAGDEDERY